MVQVVKIIHNRQTMYIHLNEHAELQSAHLGGDYLDVTEKLTASDRERLILKALEKETAA